MEKGRDLKPHIGIFGRRNNGKSSFINALVGQEVAIVSELPGTTTDPVKKSFEIFGIGPAIIIDTAGIDDSGDIGEKRVRKTIDIMQVIDCAVLMISENVFGSFEKDLIQQFGKYEIPYFIIHNKCDINPLDIKTLQKIRQMSDVPVLDFSTFASDRKEEIIQALKETIPTTTYQKVTLFDDILAPNDYVVLVMPIDQEAPDGRLILPQVMAIRDVLDHNAISVVLQNTELDHFFNTCNVKPKLVVTDSQAFGKIKDIVPAEVYLTGFSLLFARLKGDFDAYLKGTPHISKLKDGDTVLIMESCSHHVNCDDIGRFKIPNWLAKFTGENINIEVVSSFEQAKQEITNYAMVIQCGGCMFTRKQVLNRLKPAIDKGIPVSNYGMAIAYMHGIFDRATEIFIKK
ncbi:MAG: [FeFe] hydrogenase H-cluster maturation GTPase HydF [Bacteroidales bacterium]|jgi:[FeFe] hydrogenase H-cluster maturation GTPase HydF|nr:[FeFe] hydrogenase H-cluster maturation GTPase HydF [Bacteroidales bacterium]